MQNLEYLRYKALALAIIDLAKSDARIEKKDGSIPLEASEARIFLLGESPLWKESRDFWCSVADVEPDYLFKEIIKEPWYAKHLYYKEHPSEKPKAKKAIFHEQKQIADNCAETLLKNYMIEQGQQIALSSVKKKELRKTLDEAAGMAIAHADGKFLKSYKEYEQSLGDSAKVLSAGAIYSLFINFKKEKRIAKKKEKEKCQENQSQQQKCSSTNKLESELKSTGNSKKSGRKTSRSKSE